MNTKLVLRRVLTVIGILGLFGIVACLTPPLKTKAKARVQRMNSVNAAPHVVLSAPLSNTTALTITLPTTGR
ncbi:MAG: hypothetical protein WCQ21_25970 [Verrucomicrobiota bacterium]|jgi:H+/Cl- antiporter ClcA